MKAISPPFHLPPRQNLCRSPEAQLRWAVPALDPHNIRTVPLASQPKNAGPAGLACASCSPGVPGSPRARNLHAVQVERRSAAKTWQPQKHRLGRKKQSPSSRLSLPAAGSRPDTHFTGHTWPLCLAVKRSLGQPFQSGGTWDADTGSQRCGGGQAPRSGSAAVQQQGRLCSQTAFQGHMAGGS